MYRPSLNDLNAVLAIARKGSFRAAALDLGMSTTGLSNAVGKLEASLGVRLFNRTTRSVSPTDAGRLFVERAGPALQDIHGAMEAVRSQQATPSGTLRINAFATAAREILSPLVLEFLRRHRQVHVDLVTEGRLVDIVAEGFDLGVRASDLVPSDMIAVPLGRPQRYAVVGSPAYFEKHKRPRVPPDLVEITVEKVAINAVMAGCKPEYLPWVIAGLEAVCNDTFNIHGVLATTMPVGPVIVCNGPGTRAIGMNSGMNVFGQGNRANLTIGRAIQLIIRNIGGGRPGEVDRATHGNPGKISFCFAEDELGSPWSTLAESRGLSRSTDAVTVFPGEGPRCVVDQLARDPESLTNTFAACLRTLHNPKSVCGH